MDSPAPSDVGVGPHREASPRSGAPRGERDHHDVQRTEYDRVRDECGDTLGRELAREVLGGGRRLRAHDRRRSLRRGRERRSKSCSVASKLGGRVHVSHGSRRILGDRWEPDRVNGRCREHVVERDVQRRRCGGRTPGAGKHLQELGFFFEQLGGPVVRP